jgi:hypothetical protein
MTTAAGSEAVRPPEQRRWTSDCPADHGDLGGGADLVGNAQGQDSDSIV